MSMETILIIILLIVIFGGGGSGGVDVRHQKDRSREREDVVLSSPQQSHRNPKGGMS